jgi:hypothetical protein
VTVGDFVRVNGRDSTYIVTGVYSNGVTFAPVTGGPEDGVADASELTPTEYEGDVVTMDEMSAVPGGWRESTIAAGRNVRAAMRLKRERRMALGHPGDGSRWDEI